MRRLLRSFLRSVVDRVTDRAAEKLVSVAERVCADGRGTECSDGVPSGILCPNCGCEMTRIARRLKCGRCEYCESR